MKISHLFIDRPIFASVLSILIVLVGLVAYWTLPLAQYPEIAPPTIVVSATYPGASAEVAAETVAAPIEQEINGVENMLYMSSNATGNGAVSISVTFRLGTDLDTAQVLVQNRVAVAEPRLPEEVRRLGVTVRKSSPDLMMVIHVLSPDGSYDQVYVSNYVLRNVRDVLARVDGVGSITIFGARDYAMRVWLRPDRIAAIGLTAGDIVAALRGQNLQVASGVLNQPPTSAEGAFQINVQTLGRLAEPEQFGDVVIKSDPGGVVRLKDVAEIELGAQDYSSNSYLDDREAVGIAIFQQPGSNALATADRVMAAMRDLAASFPKGIAYDIVYNPTDYVRLSVAEVFKTIYEAVAIVVLVILVFLGSWRAAVIPIVAIPVSLIGTFAAMAALGFSLNNLSLFALVLAVCIVVDDAIVVVENVERHIEEGLSPRDAAYRGMDEVSGAVVAIALVLVAVFLPTAFITGISGQFYRQFAVTISVATLISAFLSLTLSPALSALLLRPRGARRTPLLLRPFSAFSRGFNRAFAGLSRLYGGMTRRLVRMGALLLLVYAGLLALTGWRFAETPQGFIPAQDRGFLIAAVQLPPGASLARTDALVRRAASDLQALPGIAHTVGIAGFSGATFTSAPNSGAIFLTLADYGERARLGLTLDGIVASARQKMAALSEGMVLVIPPPPVSGVGNAGGYKMMIEDRAGRGPEVLLQATQGLMMAAVGEPELRQVFTLFENATPQVYADIDRIKAQMLGVPLGNVFEALSVYLGSAFVNDFNFLGRTYRVTAQADAAYRRTREDIARLKTRNAAGEMVPIGSVAGFEDRTAPFRVPRYNLYPAAELQGDTAPGFSTGQALARMEALARQHLPEGMGFEWTELAYQQRSAGNTGMIAFAGGVLCVFLLLAALYESWLLPLAVILIVPMCLLSAILGVDARAMDNNILTQIGLVVLIGLAAKNAILIVEFARQAEEEGQNRFEAAVTAARTRLRPILMTSFAFIFGVVPLVIASGAGAEMRRALGTAVFSGMLGVTFFGLIFTPVFYVLVRRFGRKRRHGSPAPAVGAAAPVPAAE